MADDLAIWQGNTPLVTDTILQGDPAVVFDLTAATVRFRMRPAHAANLVVDQAATIVSATAGTVSYQTIGANTATTGEFAAWWQITKAGQVIDTDEFNVTITAHAPLDFTASGPITGPCADWVTADEVAAFCGDGSTAPGGPDYTFAASTASQVLFELSGRQFAGACQSTVRPCSQTCGCWGGFVGTLAIQGALELGVPINWTGGFWDCGGSQCGCGILSEVVLDGYPVTGIVQVKIGGVVQSPTTYRLDGYRRLVCTNSQLWPACQDLTVDDTQQGSWSVTYTHGIQPPLAGKQAACQLACQFLLAQSGQACGLPEAVQSVTRQGIQVTKGRLATLVNAIGDSPEGSGLALVDAFLAAYNRGGLRRRPAVWSPDSPRYPRRTL
jgi:hypothetical protein